MPLIELQNLVKTFGGVTALFDVSLAIEAGECHGLMGENGAGKSTLGKILAGIHAPDSGSIVIGGQAQKFSSPRQASRAGVAMVHQELAFCPDLSVAENLVMNQYPARLGFLDRRAMRRRATDLLGQVGLEIDVRQPMRALSTAQEQLVQIAAAVGAGARIIIFDEPTSSLAEPEAQRLFALIERLKSAGRTLIYVSHRMPEVFRLCDRVSVLRDGRYVGTLDRRDATQDQLVQMMIGRPLAEYFPRHLQQPLGAALLEAANLSSPGKFSDITFSIRAGEIVGFAGLIGAGRSEIASAIFGLDRAARGSVKIGGQPLKLGSPSRAMRLGLGFVPEDRKRQGLILSDTVRHNFSLPSLGHFSRFGFVDQRRERREARGFFDRLRVRAPSIDSPVAVLSGGNQQKVALVKWLARDSRVLIIDEPTRGVDIGAKAAIHALIDDLARCGAAILLISSELPEVLALSTRILVLRRGRIVGELPHAQATPEKVLHLMAGLT